MSDAVFIEAQHPRGKGGKFVRAVGRDAEDVIPDTAILNSWAGAGAALNGELASLVVNGASRIRIRENPDETRYAEVSFPPVDLEEKIGDLFVGSNTGDTVEEWFEQHDDWVNRWFIDRNVTLSGDSWSEKTFTVIADLNDDVNTLHDLTALYDQSMFRIDIAAAADGRYTTLWDQIDEDIKDTFCAACLGDKEGSPSEYCDTCQTDDEDDY